MLQIVLQGPRVLQICGSCWKIDVGVQNNILCVIMQYSGVLGKWHIRRTLARQNILCTYVLMIAIQIYPLSIVLHKIAASTVRIVLCFN